MGSALRKVKLVIRTVPGRPVARRGCSERRQLELLLRDYISVVAPKLAAPALAQRLAQRYESLALILEAQPQDLILEGATKSLARQLTFIPDLARYMRTESVLKSKQKLCTKRTCGDYFAARCFGLLHECVIVICLGKRGDTKGIFDMAEGTDDEVPIYPREIIRRALQCDAHYLVLCHNHPSGTRASSAMDVEVTRALMEICKHARIVVLDHLIVADSDVVSMREDEGRTQEFLNQAPNDKINLHWAQD